MDRLPQNGAPRDLMGGVPLDAHLVKNRVGEILLARHSDPVATPRVSRQIAVIQKDSKAKNVNVAFVQQQYDDKRCEIVAYLRAIGVDPASGSFSLDDGKLGAAMAGPNEPPQPCVVFTLTWEANGSKPEKPALSLLTS